MGLDVPPETRCHSSRYSDCFLLGVDVPIADGSVSAEPDNASNALAFVFGYARFSRICVWPCRVSTVAGYTGWQDDERAGVVALRADQLFFRFDCDTLLRKEDSEWGEANIEMCVVLSP